MAIKRFYLPSFGINVEIQLLAGGYEVNCLGTSGIGHRGSSSYIIINYVSHLYILGLNL
jgi:hypothetical protein